MIKLGGKPEIGQLPQLKVKYGDAARIVLLLIVDGAVPDATQWDFTGRIDCACEFDKGDHFVSYYIQYLSETPGAIVQ
ncbi:unnamed protein product [Mycena citricolor]|uniref:Uncharacterized protein n=1 Tax=Mycena citricolor TaxID=2018698 RepID=A0AAD2Q1H1_9AGAR|nr:unnamed protein product [Mycena citricolor]